MSRNGNICFFINELKMEKLPKNQIKFEHFKNKWDKIVKINEKKGNKNKWEKIIIKKDLYLLNYCCKMQEYVDLQYFVIFSEYFLSILRK